jgi:hypothetical protein
LKKHGITKHGRKTPNRITQLQFPPPGIATNGTNQQPLIRQAGAYVQLTTTVVQKPFQDALVALVVICQLALSLVVNDLFSLFLTILFPKIDQLLPKHGNTIRTWIMAAFKSRKDQLIASFQRCQSNVNFSFDLWTSPNHKALLGIVAHYVDEYGVLQSVSNFRFLCPLSLSPGEP